MYPAIPLATTGPQAAAMAAMLYPAHRVVQVGPSQILDGPGEALRTQIQEGLALDVSGNAGPNMPDSQDSIWHHITACVAATEGTQVISRANAPRIATLLSEDAFRRVWPHARAFRSDVCAARTLDSVLLESGRAPAADWLLVECHPAGEVLRGATSLLATVRVLWVAVALALPPGWPESAGLDDVDGLAARAGLRRIWFGASLNPMLGHALYVRDPALLIQQLGEARVALSDMTGALERARLANLQAERALVQMRTDVAALDERLSLARLENADLAAQASGVETLETEIASRAQETETLRMEVLQHFMALEALHEEQAALVRNQDALQHALKQHEVRNLALQQALDDKTSVNADLQRELALQVVEIETLRESVRCLEKEKDARRVAALEEFRLARIHAQKAAERQSMHDQIAAKSNEMEARLACLNQMMGMVSAQLAALTWVGEP